MLSKKDFDAWLKKLKAALPETIDGVTVFLETEAEHRAVLVLRGQGLGDKVYAFKKQRRKGFHKTIGHRQPFTEIEITGIEG